MLGVRKACHAIADSLREIQRENDRLKAENAELREVCRRYMRRIVPELCEQNAELHRENATLRTQLADVTVSMGRVEERCAKLRELCSALYEFAYDEYPDGAELNFADRMRELGVEVEHE